MAPATTTPTSTPEPPTPAGLWGYDDDGDNLVGYALRVTPGANPDADRWHFGGQRGVDCRPLPQADGWRFEGCTGATGDNGLPLFMPRADAGFRVQIGSGASVREISLAKFEERREPVSTNNVRLRWHETSPGGASNYGIWAEDGLVFAPTSAGNIQIRDARGGALLGQAMLGSAPLTGRGPVFAQEVKARNGILYVATIYRGLLIYDVRDPAAPRFLSQYIVDAGFNSNESFTNIHNLFVSPRGDIVYAINQSHDATDLRLIDVSDPVRPREAGRFAVRTQGFILDGQHDINVIERNGRLIAFLNHLGSGLYILDVTDPAAVRRLGEISWDGVFSHAGWPFESGGRLYYAHGDEGFDQGLTVLDVTDLSAPKIVSRFKTRAGVSIHNIEVVDRIAYVAYYIDGLRVIDLRDPASPREIGHYDTVAATDEQGLFQGAWGVRYHDGIAFISDMETGVYAFEVTVPPSR
jgi:hypothetical protein